MKTVFVVGPPCAGKSTYVEQTRAPADLVLDMDTLAHALGYPHEQIRWGPGEEHDHVARAAALIARAAVMKHIVTTPRPGTAWVVSTNHVRTGDDAILLDPGREECHTRARADGRAPSTHEQIDRWYDTRPTSSRTW